MTGPFQQYTDPFEFLDIALPPDGDLRLTLAECVPGVIGAPPECPLDSGVERKKLCYSLALK